MNRLSLEVVQLILEQVHLASLPVAMQVCRNWHRLVLELLPKQLDTCSLGLPLTQEGIWSHEAQFKFSHFNKADMSLTFLAQDLQPNEFFYAVLISRPSAKTMSLKIKGNQSKVKQKIRLDTKKEGLYCHKARQFTIKYAVKVAEKIPNSHLSRGGRLITPLSFQCSLNFISQFQSPTKQSLWNPITRLLCLSH
ncbi:hypothetical protein DSO57_1006056 [Entomophthora muscae]|uniref:Uncharacterized protein n=1 Tax=Entomophthora muscae TaxID=34485 RepID=A0ACC2U6U0_9FUNG|nr:hypothetical protein DSO57_1006056 [Entomophthora muscae]